jgi:hypothetical protein
LVLIVSIQNAGNLVRKAQIEQRLIGHDERALLAGQFAPRNLQTASLEMDLLT